MIPTHLTSRWSCLESRWRIADSPVTIFAGNPVPVPKNAMGVRSTAFDTSKTRPPACVHREVRPDHVGRNDAGQGDGSPGSARFAIVRHSTWWLLCRTRHSSKWHPSSSPLLRPIPNAV
jgi:hypothetical protein